jgi:hypothetical protein
MKNEKLKKLQNPQNLRSRVVGEGADLAGSQIWFYTVALSVLVASLVTGLVHA